MAGNLYVPGTVVFVKVSPGLELVVWHFAKRIYHCTVQEYRGQKELVYYEREVTKTPLA
ncbi:hypothetical protein [Rufibacter latericius]|uniref:hypothetical protein n=1 Tax=Rufibacter latericius TaxID=2487040 RepID=UPI0014040E2A|nr:hypothetical protein [Rufibacter latericius]